MFSCKQVLERNIHLYFHLKGRRVVARNMQRNIKTAFKMHILISKDFEKSSLLGSFNYKICPIYHSSISHHPSLPRDTFQSESFTCSRVYTICANRHKVNVDERLLWVKLCVLTSRLNYGWVLYGIHCGFADSSGTPWSSGRERERKREHLGREVL